MKIAAVTDDGTTISRHFGRAGFYMIVTVQDGEIVAREKVARPAHGRHVAHAGNVQLHESTDEHTHTAGQHNHDHDHDHADMLAPVRDCAIVLTRGMGNGAHRALTAAGLRPIITDIAGIDDAVRACIDGTIVDHPEKLH